MSTNQTYQQIEKVRRILANVFSEEETGAAIDFWKKQPAEMVGERDFRIPLQFTLGGRFGYTDLNMGDMGRGTGPTGDKLITTFISTRMNFELSMQQIMATANKQIAVQAVFKQSVSKGIPEFMRYLNRSLHTDGSTVLGVATATGTGPNGETTYTMDANFRQNRLRRGQFVNVYPADLSAPKSASQLYIKTINWGTNTVFMSGVVPGAAATDRLCAEGVVGPSPMGILGLYYYNSSAQSGYTLGINRAQEPEIITNYVTANGALTNELGMFLYNKIIQRKGEQPPDLVGFMPLAQEAKLYNDVILIQNWDANKPTQNGVDRSPAFRGKKFVQFADMKHMIDPAQDNSRIDYVSPAQCGRVALPDIDGSVQDVDFFRLPGSNQRFFQLSGGSGGPAAGVWFGFISTWQTYIADMSCGGVIESLTLPTIYQ